MSAQRAYMILWQNQVGGEVDRNYVICLGQEDDCIALTDTVNKMLNKYGPVVCGGDTIRVVELDGVKDIPKGQDYTVVGMPSSPPQRKNLRQCTLSKEMLTKFHHTDWFITLKQAGFVFVTESCPYKLAEPFEHVMNGDGSVTWRQWEE